MNILKTHEIIHTDEWASGTQQVGWSTWVEQLVNDQATVVEYKPKYQGKQSPTYKEAENKPEDQEEEFPQDQEVEYKSGGCISLNDCCLERGI